MEKLHLEPCFRYDSVVKALAWWSDGYEFKSLAAYSWTGTAQFYPKTSQIHKNAA